MNSGLPGLAMSRSIGDYIAKRIGVIFDPEITVTMRGDENKYAIIASDGVWDCMSNERVWS